MDSRTQISMWLLIAFAVGILVVSFEYEQIAGAVVVGLGVAIVLITLVPKLIPREDRSFAINILVVAIIAKFVAVAARLWVSESLYGYGDSEGYHQVGIRLAELILSGDFAEVGQEFAVGTSFIGIWTASLYSVIGPAKWGGFLIFGVMALVGSLLFYRAFRIAFPSGDGRFFLLLVLLYPALLFWPSALGKDAPILLFSGLSTYGIALLVTRGRLSGVWFLAPGIAGAFMVRPSVAMVLVIGMTLALLVMRPSATISSWVSKLLVLGAVVAASTVVITIGGQFLELESLTPEGVIQRFAIENTRDYDVTGAGSNFDIPEVTDPMWVPSAVVTVLFRPFFWEASNAQSLLQSVDGLLMGIVLLIGGRRLLMGWRHVESKSFFSYVLVVVVMTILVLGTLGNFGLLARQRATLLPFVFMAVAAVPYRSHNRRLSKDRDIVSSPSVEQQVRTTFAGS